MTEADTTTQPRLHDLELIRHYELSIRRLSRDRDRVASLLQRVVPPPDAVRVMGGQSDGINLDAIDRLYRLEREMDRKIDSMVDLKREACAILDSMDDPMWAEVLDLRYMEGKSIGEIARMLPCHRATVHRAIRSGLAEYDRIKMRHSAT